MSDQVLPSTLINDFSERYFLKLPNSFFKKAKSYLEYKDLKKIQKAYTFAFYSHDGQQRRDGSNYITHPVEVASILLELRMDPDTICAALMHDVLEDCDVNKGNLRELFGEDVAEIVDGVSKLGKLDITARMDRDANNLQKMMLAISKDVRVVLVKICDRLHNMRTIEHLPRSKQIKKSKETIELYGPLALRIGMQDIRSELEDLAFRCIHPLRATMLESAIKKSSGGRKKIVYKIRKEIKSHLKTNQIMSTVKGREKNLFSIYRKIKTKHKPFSEVLDVYGFRIIVNSVEDCYKSLGLIHNYYKPIEQRFKDYIAIPKSNGYQALHTTLLALDSIPIEIQIQTKSMELIAENGICAHASYKNKDINDSSFHIRNWMESLQDLHDKSSSTEDFVESIKTDLFSDEVYVFSPKGQIFNLKTGSTPVDFAYEVHTDIGNSLVGCKINRKYAPLNIQLESGQTVEIETDKKAIVDPGWLNFVVTSKARTAIRAQLRHQKTSSARKAGKLLLESELKRSGKALKEYRGNILKSILQKTGVKSLNQLLTDIGLGRKTSTIVAERFFDGLKIRKDKTKTVKSFELKNNKIDGLSVTYGKCCMPIEGDSIVAHSDTERGIVIHHSRCNEVTPYKQDKERYIPSFWSKTNKKQVRPCHIKVLSESGPGVLADIASTFTKSDINIISVVSKSAGSKLTEFSFDIEIIDLEELKKIMQKVRSMKIVSSCVRDINEAKKK